MKRPLIFVFVLITLISPLNAFTAPVEVVFFPDGAKVTEITKVVLKEKGSGTKTGTIYLPHQADPDTLGLSLVDGKGVVEDQQWQQIERQDEEKVKKLKQTLKRLKDERSHIQAHMKSLDIQIQFWQQQAKTKMKTIGDISSLSSVIGKNARRIMEERINLEQSLEELDKQISRVQEELNAVVGKKDTVWAVTVEISGTNKEEVTLKYSYFLKDCGWKSVYRFDGRPKLNSILFSWQGQVWQSSGSDWKNVIVYLANTQPPKGLAPPEIPHWIIQPKKRARVSRSRMAVESKMATEIPVEEKEDESETSTKPQLIQVGTYQVWDTGKRNIPAGTKHRINIAEENWSSEFNYISRPSKTSEVFVQAHLDIPPGKEIPSGEAVFLLDGALVGRSEISLSVGKQNLHFGMTPLVTAKQRLITKKEGETGLLDNKAMYRWEWITELENLYTYPVKVRLEEPRPQSRHERIKIETAGTPPPTEETHDTLVWMFNIPAGKKIEVRNSVTVEAPRDMPLDLGWR